MADGILYLLCMMLCGMNKSKIEYIYIYDILLYISTDIAASQPPCHALYLSNIALSHKFKFSESFGS